MHIDLCTVCFPYHAATAKQACAQNSVVLQVLRPQMASSFALTSQASLTPGSLQIQDLIPSSSLFLKCFPLHDAYGTFCCRPVKGWFLDNLRSNKEPVASSPLV